MESKKFSEPVTVKMCDENTIPCKDCKWSVLCGPFKTSCIKYSKHKPYEVYYESKECEKFEKR